MSLGNTVKTRRTILNAVVRLAQSILPSMLLLVLNRMIIRAFGSDVNGVLSTAAQVVNFLTLFEAGFTLSTTVALYKPYIDGDLETINGILRAGSVFYRRMGLIAAATGIVVSVVVPFVISSNLKSTLIIGIFLISVLNMSLTFLVTMKYGIMFSVSQQEYKPLFVILCFQLLSLSLCIVTISFVQNILAIRMIWYFVPLSGLPLIVLLSKRNFPGIRFNSGALNRAGITGAKDVFAQRIAALVTNNSGIFIVSILMNTLYSSVFSVYYFVYSGLKQILFAFVLAPLNAFGQLYANKDLDVLRATFRTYHFFCTILITILLTTGNILIIPFVKLYTSGVVDVDYIDYYFALSFSISVFLELISNIMGGVINGTGLFKPMKTIVLVGAAINIVVSAVLAKPLGLVGVSLGSIASYLIMNRSFFRLLYRDVLKESSRYFVKYVSVNVCLSAILTLLAARIHLPIASYFGFCIYGVLILSLVAVIIVGTNFLVDRIQARKVVGRLFSKIAWTRGSN